MAATATLTGTYCAVTDKASLPTLRQQFLPLALSLGLPDLDAGILRLPAPRSLTRQVAAWVYDLYEGPRELFDGVGFESRHGDGLTLWAVFERARDSDVSACLHDTSTIELHRDDPALLKAFLLHHLTWNSHL